MKPNLAMARGLILKNRISIQAKLDMKINSKMKLGGSLISFLIRNSSRGNLNARKNSLCKFTSSSVSGVLSGESLK